MHDQLSKNINISLSPENSIKFSPMPPAKMSFGAGKFKKPSSYGLSINIALAFCLILVFTVPATLLLHTPSPGCLCNNLNSGTKPWSGDLRRVEFSLNKFEYPADRPPPVTLRIAVFTRKWPTTSTPGGMERHAKTLHTVLAARGHRINIFTSPPVNKTMIQIPNLVIHWYDGEPDKWHPDKAWEIFQEQEKIEKFDVIHTESVSLPHWLAIGATNVAVSWHGIALESVESSIYLDLARKPDEPRSSDFTKSLKESIPKVLKEIRFFSSYAHHIATSDSCGEMLRDVYQIPSLRVHVIANGVHEDFAPDPNLGQKFRSDIGIPKNASLVFGVAGRLVKDKGHPLLFEAFSKFMTKHPNVYLIVAGSGPWESRYKELDPQVLALGSMNPNQLRAFYNAIDIFVNPTLRPQGIDHTLNEAMMTGKPIMASRFPSIRGTIVVNNEFGFMFTPNVQSLYDTLELVAAEGAGRLAVRGAACNKYASFMFTAKKMAMAHERLFLCISNSKYCAFP